MTIPKDSAKLDIVLDLETFVPVVFSYFNYLKRPVRLVAYDKGDELVIKEAPTPRVRLKPLCSLEDY